MLAVVVVERLFGFSWGENRVEFLLSLAVQYCQVECLPVLELHHPAVNHSAYHTPNKSGPFTYKQVFGSPTSLEDGNIYYANHHVRVKAQAGRVVPHISAPRPTWPYSGSCLVQVFAFPAPCLICSQPYVSCVKSDCLDGNNRGKQQLIVAGHFFWVLRNRILSKQPALCFALHVVN